MYVYPVHRVHVHVCAFVCVYMYMYMYMYMYVCSWIITNVQSLWMVHVALVGSVAGSDELHVVEYRDVVCLSCRHTCVQAF